MSAELSTLLLTSEEEPQILPEEPKTLTEFTLFSKLPPELRLRVWKFTLPGPRTVVLNATLCPDTGLHSPYTSLTGPPAGLSVCSESRAEYLKTYKLLPTTPYCKNPPIILFKIYPNLLIPHLQYRY